MQLYTCWLGGRLIACGILTADCTRDPSTSRASLDQFSQVSFLNKGSVSVVEPITAMLQEWLQNLVSRLPQPSSLTAEKFAFNIL